MIIICVLVGVPGSGKSSFARSVDISPYRKIVFSYDDIEEQRDVDYKLYRKIVKDRLELLIQDEIENQEPTVIIVDDIMILRSMRYEIFRIYRKLNLKGFCQIYFHTDLDVCIERNNSRHSSAITEHMIRSQWMRLERPGGGQSEIDKCALTIENNCYRSEDVVDLINMAATRIIPVQPIPKGSSATEQSTVHKIDIILRKHIGQCISDKITPEEKKLLAKELNERRHELLQDIRNKTVIFEDPLPADEDIINYL